MTKKEFDALPEYSFFLPSGIKVGERWKTQFEGIWFFCELVDKNGFPEIKIVRVR